MSDIYLWDPFTSFIKINTTLVLKGIFRQLFDIIAKRLSVQNYTFQTPTDTANFGTKLDNGSWDGLLGLVANNNCHISITPLEITDERRKSMIFSSVVMYEPYVILTNTDRNGRPQVTGYIGVFLTTPSLPLAHTGAHLKGVLCIVLVCVTLLTICFNSFIDSKLVVVDDYYAINTLDQLASNGHVIPSYYFGTPIEEYLRSPKQEFKRHDLYVMYAIIAQIKPNISSINMKGRTVGLRDLLDKILYQRGKGELVKGTQTMLSCTNLLNNICKTRHKARGFSFGSVLCEPLGMAYELNAYCVKNVLEMFQGFKPSSDLYQCVSDFVE
ncbi:unnamed protein product [Medioppia subpectinata]|uniref:Ionotropic glutamate receptor L-glutamate and glycine-binding domain-containing protein n=1 Tax=Medioppia subpectinata TaxID=1979941 RepID=A0A7R9KEA6_9ACAR|nr:unnamed protein product [Medioppia subpectinata]CAG2101797.1 unnamed protein product [Medioppia subpectinata]